MYKRVQVQVIAVLMTLMFLAACTSSCAMLGGSVKTLTAKQQATLWMVVYNSVFDDTMAQAKNPAATAAQKDLVAKKKAVLTQVWPLLKIYAGVVETGGTPSVETAQAISDLINQLAALAATK
jgi:uncharacterized membrane protein